MYRRSAMCRLCFIKSLLNQFHLNGYGKSKCFQNIFFLIFRQMIVLEFKWLKTGASICENLRSYMCKECQNLRGTIYKFSAPCTSGYQRMKIWPLDLLFNIISIQGNALSPSLFEFSYPFKIEGFFLYWFYCLYDAFIASILCTMKKKFQFWEQIEVGRSHFRRIWRIRKDFKSTFSRSSHGNLWRVGRGVVMQVQSTASQFPRLFLAISWRSRLNSPA